MNRLRPFLSHILCRDQKVRTFCRYVSFQLLSRLTGKRRIYQWVDGAKLYIRHGMPSASAQYYTGMYDAREMCLLMHLLRKEDLFLDLGANVGAYSILLARGRECTVVAAEAVPQTYQCLCDNITLNNLEARVEAHACAAGEAEGSLSFVQSKGMANHVSYEGQSPAQVVEVAVVPAADLLNSRIPTAIKLDVEGYETPCLRSLAATIRHPDCQLVIVELENKGSRYGYDEAEAVTLLTDSGFTEYDFDPLNRELRDAALRPPENSNHLFIRDVNWARARIAEAPTIRVRGHKL